ncbi:DUF4160 domain-containing protein [Desulfonatronum parangueonense]
MAMPGVARFYGIIIAMFHNEHNPPHFHARSGEYKIVLDIHTLQVFDGKLRNCSKTCGIQRDKPWERRTPVRQRCNALRAKFRLEHGPSSLVTKLRVDGYTCTRELHRPEFLSSY